MTFLNLSASDRKPVGREDRDNGAEAVVLFQLGGPDSRQAVDP